MAQTKNLGKVALTPRGVYAPGSSYEKLDIVTYGGASWLCLQDVQGVTPVAGVYWMQLTSKGDTGATGQAATVAVGTVTTGAPGSSATVTNSGTTNNAVLNFSIPQGMPGAVTTVDNVSSVGGNVPLNAVVYNSTMSLNSTQQQNVRTSIAAASSTHTHGSITNGGAITGTTAVASGDGLIFADNSDSSKLKRTSASFDGSTTTQFLAKSGSFATPVPTGNTTITVTDLNNACHSTNNQIQWYAFTSSATNNPGFGGCCFYMSFAHPWGFQVAFSEGANIIAMRWKNPSGTWGSSWLKVTLS